MAYSVVIELPAERRLDSTLQYYVDALGMPQSAARLLGAFEIAASSISEHPTFYPVYQRACKSLGETIHWKSVLDFRIYFTVSEADKTIHIFSFLHKKQVALLPLENDLNNIEN